MVVFAVGGFILLHSSQVQPKNTSSVIIANLLSIAVGTIVFWGVGFAFSIGNGTAVNSNFFLSYDRFFLIDASDSEYQLFGSELVYLMLVLVLCNSGFVSRMRYWMYPLLTLFISGIIYPFALHWTKHTEGWLRNGIEVTINGQEKILSFSDAGGASWIHVFAGSVSLIGTIMLAPRKDRQGKKFKPVGGNLTPLMLAGYFMVVLGLLSSNTFKPKSLTNSLLAAQGAAFVSFSLKRTGCLGDKSSTKALINGSIAGLVAICSVPGEYLAYGAFVVGVIGGLAYTVWSALLQCCRIDDPTDSAAIHLGSGLWAVIASPLFKQTTGIIYDPSKYNMQVFGWHFLGAMAIFVWSGLTVFVVLIVFVCTRAIKYSGREPAELGLDQLEHKEPAYPDREQYLSDRTDQILDDLFLGKDNGIYGVDNRAHMDSGAFDNQDSRRAATEGFTKY